MIKPANQLPTMSESPSGADVCLFPNSGVQFIDVPLDLGRMRLTRDWYEELRTGTDETILRQLESSEQDERSYYEVDGRRRYVRSDSDDWYTIDKDSALRPFLGKWVPIPFLEEVRPGAPGDRLLQQGPENWARIRVLELASPDAGGQSHRAVLAFDTMTQEKDEPAYLSPREDSPASFVLANGLPEVSWLVDGKRDPAWLNGWIEELYRQRDRTGRPFPKDQVLGQQHVATYLTFLDILHQIGALPRVRLLHLNAVEDHTHAYVDVDLVLDLGNSRSCGFLLENVPGHPRSVANAYRLQLRDLSRPEEVSDTPFPSRVEFAAASFGDSAWSSASGRGEAFEWPSPVRVGPEAARLSGLSRGNDGQTGLSSPKRYLWDDQKRLGPWRANRATEPEGMIRGGFLAHVTEDGSVLSYTGESEIAMRALFSRASLFTFFLLEVMLQARSQMNSFAAREGRVEKFSPRRLANLVLTLPPAMPAEEVTRVRQRAEAALHLLADVTGGMGARPCSRAKAALILKERDGEVGGLRGRPEEKVEATLDEATATQVVHLYDQITQVFRGDAQLCFAVNGRPRDSDGGDEQVSLRIASIDVGGGTTDLCIQTYGLDHNVVVPHENFREGFRLAGDDVLETVLMRHVMPGLLKSLAAAGLSGDRARGFLIGAFRSPPRTEPERQARRLALDHVLAPAALALLTEYEGWEPLTLSRTETRRLGDLLAKRKSGLQARYPEEKGAAAAEPGGVAAAWFNEQARDRGAQGFCLEDVELEYDPAAIHGTVRQQLREAIEPLCEIIKSFSSDIILLSGRGSRWPAVLELVTGSMAIPPDRVQPMHRYRVGPWYPFPDENGRISDPKTTVAVGAMLQRLLKGSQLDNLALRDRFGTRSTARYVGKVETNGRIRSNEILFSGVDLDVERGTGEAKITFPGSCFIGFRQFAAERWPATRLYRLALKPTAKPNQFVTPFTLTISRTTSNPQKTGRAAEEANLKFAIVPGSAVDRNEKPLGRDIELRLQTTPGNDGNHWLDSGQLEALDTILDNGSAT